ncbi:MAG: hypothetical protein ACTSR3_00990 [Candidatus Helarchaeota archaeon]
MITKVRYYGNITDKEIRKLYKKTYRIWKKVKKLKDFKNRRNCPFCQRFYCTNCQIDERLCGLNNDLYEQIEHYYNYKQEKEMLETIKQGLKIIKEILKNE